MKLPDITVRSTILYTIIILTALAVVEFFMGRLPWCECGYIKLWHGAVFSSENSQHLSDWYSFTHVLHGFIFYALLSIVAKRLPVRARLVIAIVLEVLWEILENTDFVINRYRAATISLDYFGDSIVNSLSDVVAMMIGFYAAYKLPFWVTVIAFIAVELALLYFIRDNLTINAIMLIYPIEAIKSWQNGL